MELEKMRVSLAGKYAEILSIKLKNEKISLEGPCVNEALTVENIDLK